MLSAPTICSMQCPSGVMSQEFRINPCWNVKWISQLCWQGADDEVVVLFMQPRTTAGLEPVFVCIFFHVLLANPAHVHEISERLQGLLEMWSHGQSC